MDRIKENKTRYWLLIGTPTDVLGLDVETGHPAGPRVPLFLQA